MPFKHFDRARMILEPLARRQHDIHKDVMIDPDAPARFEHPALAVLGERIRRARERNSTVLWMLGAHVIRGGCGPVLIRLMREGYLTHVAINGAGAIHDFELAMIGATTESVARYISEGRFGLWNESGRINDAVKAGVRDGLSFGEAVGRMIDEEDFPYKENSLLRAGYKYRVPVTVHVGIGCDIIHEHPNCDGATTGAASYADFLIYVQSILNLEGGVFCNIGNGVMGPEMFQKALSMARNVADREGGNRSGRPTDFTAAVFDLLPLEGRDLFAPPPENDPCSYFRPWKMILAQTVADGGEGFYVAGEHRDTVPALGWKIRGNAGKAGVPSQQIGEKAAEIPARCGIRFDRSRLTLAPISERVPGFTQAGMIDPDAPAPLEHATLDILADRVRKARDRRSASRRATTRRVTTLWMLGASVIRNGNGPVLRALMEEEYVNFYALNGAAAFQDFELALVGGTMEDGTRYVSAGRFGLWTETAEAFNRAVVEGAGDGLGFGEALGRAIDRGDFPYKKNSVLWNAYRLGCPATVHIVFGCDSYQEQPGFDPAAAGAASYTDFLVYTQAIMDLEGGVFYNFGSRTVGPEVYLKALAMTRNVAHQQGRKIARFTTAVIDVLPLEGQDIHEAPPKSDPRYYFRPWKTILARTVADGGESFYVGGGDRQILPALAHKIRRG